MTEQAEPKTAAGMLKAMEKSGDGTNVLRETMQTMKMSDGKTVKGDVLLPIANIKGALTELWKLVEAAKASGKKGSAKWEFRTSPHAQFGKSLDDTLIAFLAWARVGSDDEPDTPGENEGGDGAMTNVSKAFRRLEAYADWMESTGDDGALKGELIESSAPVGSVSVRADLGVCSPVNCFITVAKDAGGLCGVC